MSRLLDPHSTPSELVAAALAGDQLAWHAIFDRYQRLVWKTVNMMTARDEDRNEAFSRTWCRLAESLGQIREPERLAGWIRITAAREAIAVGRATATLVPVGDARLFDRLDDEAPASMRWRPEQAVLTAEQEEAVRRAFHRLDDRCRELLTLLIVQDTPLSYAEVVERLDRPHGAIGPIRRRCLEKLRRSPDLQGLFGPDAEES